LEAALATAADLVLTAQVDGVILARHVEPGETIAAGAPAVTIGRTSEPWVRVFVPARALPALEPGGAAVITTSGLNREIRGVIASINSKAEFTPRVALTEEQRADELFGVRVNAIDSTGTLKAGMPATVRFIVDSAARSQHR
jgi:HlyD family secretion protein